MSTLATFALSELIAYSTAETRRWRDWLTAQPRELLDLPAGTGRTATVRRLIHHIVVVERRYADRLHGAPVTEYEAVPSETLDDLFTAFEEARHLLRAWVDSATDDDLRRPLQFTTLTAGTLEATSRKIVIHTLLHGVRHWAQIASMMREHGHPTDWHHDILMSDALR